MAIALLRTALLFLPQKTRIQDIGLGRIEWQALSGV
jgi:hypothetical protein